jgi:hypothetical protein
MASVSRPGSSITTTLDLYGHLYPGEMDRYTDPLDEAAGDADAPKCGQMRRMTLRARARNAADLERRWRARRDSNRQPSDP